MIKATQLGGGKVGLDLTETGLEVSALDRDGSDLSIPFADIASVAGAKFGSGKPVLLLAPSAGNPTLCIRLGGDDARSLAQSLRSGATGQRSGWATGLAADFSAAVNGRLLYDPTGAVNAGTSCRAVVWGAGATISVNSEMNTLPWESITNIAVEGVDQIRNRHSVGAVLFFGVLGLAARKKEAESYLTIETAAGEWLIEVPQVLPAQVKAQLRPVLDHYANRSEPGPPSASPEDQVVDKIRQLAELRDDGVLTPEEFDQKKTELLGRL